MNDRSRAEDFLELVERSKRGRLKVYLGFAAGVGKTYRMLQEAHALKARGVDVVLGFIEPHDRAETISLVTGLEEVPRRKFAYRGVEVEDTDLDAVLTRKPQVAVIDEVAHTNAPGMRHPKRYEDVLELIDAGINVICAFNVQHLESLNDLVERTTGVNVRERIPDSFIKQADQVITLDLAVEDLLERLKAGKIYNQQKIPWALEHFFREDNLGILRELALREVVESVERASQPKNGRPASGAPHGAARKIMVCMSSYSPRAASLLRKGSRTAGRLNTDWYVVYVETPKEAPTEIDSAVQRHLHQNVAMAKELGAEVVVLKGHDPVPLLIDFARSHDVGQVIIGRTHQNWWRRMLGRDFVHRILTAADGLDVLVVALEEKVGGSMTLRRKLLLAQLPLGLALLLVGIIAIVSIGQLGDKPPLIFHENYRSVVAAERMKESIERIDSAAMFMVAGHKAEAMAQAPPNRASFEAELRVEEANITEPGEADAAARLRARWQEYQAAFDRFAALERTAQADTYFAGLQASFAQVKDAADVILTINQDAMLLKSERAKKSGQLVSDLMAVVALVALGIGVLSSGWLTARLLRPLDSLSAAARRIAEGDLLARAAVLGKDEIAGLATEFNRMAERLQEYRQSSLGKLLQAQQSSQAAIESLADPVIVLDFDGAVVSTNRAAERLFEVGRGSGGDALARAEPALRATIERVRDHVLAGKGAYNPKGLDEAVRVGTSDGEEYFLPRAAPMYAEGLGIAGVTVVLQEVTRLRRFDELKNDLVATVAHELRTPLTSLRMAVHLCLEQAAGPLSEKQMDLLSAAREDCERLQTIVDELLDLAKIQQGRVPLVMHPVAAAKLVKDAMGAFELAAREGGRTLESQVQTTADVTVDSDRIALVFANLLSNALNHTPSGGTITLRALPAGGFTRFEVTDTGPGIDAAHVARLFDRFFRVPGSGSKGAGLGLSIAKEIVEAHAGQMGVDSRLGSGTTFWFTLPVARK